MSRSSLKSAVCAALVPAALVLSVSAAERRAGGNYFQEDFPFQGACITANGPGNDAEFGTVKKEDEFHALLAMDAYHAARDGVRYPAVLTLTGANDKRVEPWQVGKFTARLQAASTNRPGAIMRVDYDAGHFATTRATGNAKMADIFGFVLAHTV